MRHVTIAIAVSPRHAGGVAQRIGGHAVVLMIMDGRHLFRLILKQHGYPIGNQGIGRFHRVDIFVRESFRDNDTIVIFRGPIRIVKGNEGSEHHFVLRVGDGLGSSAVAGKQEGIAFLCQTRNEGVFDVVVGVNESCRDVRSHLQFFADNQIITCRVGSHALGHRGHEAGGRPSAERGVGQRVEGLYSVNTAGIHILHQSNINIGRLSYPVRVAAGADALGSLEVVRGHVLVVILTSDRKG